MNIDLEYTSLLKRILANGVKTENRTGIDTISTFGEMMKVDISDNKLAVISCRRVSPRIAFEELMFMLNGKTQTKELEEKNINIWKGNTSNEFLINRGLGHLSEGDMGRMYGSQLRFFTGYDNDIDDVLWHDQLKYIIDEINNNPTSRRIITTHYNPTESDQGVLFPCHIMTQFIVRGNELDCLFWMRSSDVPYGLCYNLLFYNMFCSLIANLCNLKPSRLIYQSGDAHIYQNQLDCGMIDYMIDNAGINQTVPKFIINKDLQTLDDMLSLTFDDVTIKDYNPCPDFKDKPPMAI